MVVRLEHNLPSTIQKTETAPRKTNAAEYQEQTQVSYVGEQLDPREFAFKTSMLNDPNLKQSFYDNPLVMGGHGFDPANILQLNNNARKILIADDTEAPSLEMHKPDSAEHIDTSINEQLDVIDRNEHSDLIRNSVQNRAVWREGIPDKTQSGKIYDLSFNNLRELIGQENLNKIRNTHILRDGVQTEDKCDTLIQTLEDIGRLTDEDIAEMDIFPVTKEALTLIRNELVNANGEYDQQKARDFEKMIMNYPPNQENYIDGVPDYGKWLGEIKVGFRVVDDKLVFVKPITKMTLTASNDQRTLLLKFEADGLTYDIAYNIADLKDPKVVTTAGDEENPQLRINGEKVNVGDKTIIEYLSERHISPQDMKQKFENVKAIQYLDNSKLGANNISLTYLNRLEFVARIGIKDNFTFTDEYNRTYIFQYVTDTAIINNKEGWLYMVTVKNSDAEKLQVFMSRTKGKNDIPLISGGKLAMPRNLIVQGNGTMWVQADQNSLNMLWRDTRNRQNPYMFGSR
jgi:hypothetical protein